MFYPGCVLALLLSITTQIQIVDAGSRMWQPRITKYDHLDNPDSAGNLSSAHLNALNERYLIENFEKARLWPDNTIRYCFESEDLKTATFDKVKEAINRWWAAGLDQRIYKWEEVSQEDCTNQRATIMLIMKNDDYAGHSASTGYTPANPIYDYDGPNLRLDTAEFESLDEDVRLLTHEIGHVYGLEHEHQNPNFWEYDFILNARGGSVFNGIDFTKACKHLNGYDDAVARTQTEHGLSSVQLLCIQQEFAADMGFIAADFLPFDGANLISQPGGDVNSVDWNSVMIYDSFTSSADGTPILKKPDGSFIVQPNNPSANDVRGIQLLYETGPTLKEALLNQARSTTIDMFRRIYYQGSSTNC